MYYQRVAHFEMEFMYYRRVDDFHQLYVRRTAHFEMISMWCQRVSHFEMEYIFIREQTILKRHSYAIGNKRTFRWNSCTVGL